MSDSSPAKLLSIVEEPRWRTHAKRLAGDLLTLAIEALFLAGWTLLTYFMSDLLFERFRPPGYEEDVIHGARAIFTLALIIPVLCWVVLDALRSMIRSWREFRDWYRGREDTNDR